MGRINPFKRLLIAGACLLASCNAEGDPSTAGWGAIGAGAGAGTGALVGAVISRGDIAMSAVLGSAIGLPIGLIIGYQLQKETEEAKEKAKIDQYIAKQEDIRRQEEEIQEMREEMMLRDATRNRLSDEAEKERVYTGPTLNNPTRY